MKTPDRSQNANRWALAKLMKPVAVVGSKALFVPWAMLSAATVEYDLTIGRQGENFTGQPVEELTINGRLPGQTLSFAEGNHAAIRVHNQMDGLADVDSLAWYSAAQCNGRRSLR